MSRLIAKGDITYALAFTPYDAANPVGYQTLGQVTTRINAAIAAIPPSGGGAGLTSAQVDAKIAAALAAASFGAAYLVWAASLPTTLPAVRGVAWNNSGVITVS